MFQTQTLSLYIADCFTLATIHLSQLPLTSKSFFCSTWPTVISVSDIN